VTEGVHAGGRALTGGPGSVSNRGGERADRAGPAPEGKRTAIGVRGHPCRSIKIGRRGSEGGPRGVRAGPSRSIKIGRGKSDRE
jgi:hypothetical protein